MYETVICSDCLKHCLSIDKGGLIMEEKNEKVVEVDRKSWGYRLGLIFLTVCHASVSAVIIALAIKIIRWLLF